MSLDPMWISASVYISRGHRPNVINYAVDVINFKKDSLPRTRLKGLTSPAIVKKVKDSTRLGSPRLLEDWWLVVHIGYGYAHDVPLDIREVNGRSHER